MPRLRLALAQTNPVMGDFASNLAEMRRRLSAARQARAQLVLFPELAVCGYPPEDLLQSAGFLQANQQAVADLRPDTRGLCACVGYARRAGSQVFNAAAVLNDGRLAGHYDKIELPNYGVFDEKRYFHPGSRLLLLELSGWRLALTICEDLWVPQGPVEQAILKAGVDAVLNLSASPFHAGKFELRRRLLQRLARRARAAVAYVNLVGGQDELVFDGRSMVFDSRGRLQARAPHFAEALLVSEWTRPGGPRRPDRRFLRLAGPAAPLTPLPRSTQPPNPGRLEEIHAALVTGTRDYVRKNGFKQAVIGLSGGVDSALTAALAVEALGRGNVIGVTMPSAYSSRATRADAARVAKNLGLRLITLPIMTIYRAFTAVLRPALGSGQPGVAHENLQARIRGSLLMALSNHFGWLVLTTGNKSETAVGYCTLYGDMAGGFAMIKDVPKTLVYELAGLVNLRAGRDLIPRSVLKRAPTAELRPNQTDQDTLPPYPLLDRMLKAYIEEGRDLRQIVRRGFKPSLVRETLRRVDDNEYKRRQAPPGIKITPKAFGRDRRLPITNRFRPPRSA
ncbi:MAG: NAD+ synthase [candidate division FCPU426 bacterium]